MSATVASRWNLDALEEQYERWRRDPKSVDESWRSFFEGFELGRERRRTAATPGGATARQAGAIDLTDAYRAIGHLLARLDPLSDPPASTPLLDLKQFGLSDADLDETFDTSHFVGLPSATLRQLLGVLRATYCGTIGVEYMHIQ